MTDHERLMCPRCNRSVGIEKSSACGFEDINVRVWHVERKNGQWCSGSGEVINYPADVLRATLNPPGDSTGEVG